MPTLSEFEVNSPDAPRCAWCGKPYHILTVTIFERERDVWSKSCDCGDVKFTSGQGFPSEISVQCRFCENVVTAKGAGQTSPVYFVYCPKCGAAYGESHRELAKGETAKRIPPIYSDADFSWCPDAYSWVDEPSAGLVITGDPGTGKTWAACAVLKEWAARGLGSAMFCRASEIIDDAMDAVGKNVKRDMMEMYLSPKLLLIDDLGKENPTDFAVEMIFRVINERGEAGKPTIITTNYDAAGLFNRLSSRSKDEVTAAAILSRIATFMSVEVQRDDWRLS